MRILTRALAALWLAVTAVLPAHAQPKSASWQQVVVTPNSGAYSAGLCIGGVLTVPGMVQPQGPGGTVLTGFTFVDPQGKAASVDIMNLFVFNKLPTGTYTDHANCNIAAADAANLIATFAVISTNCVSDQTPVTTICTISPEFPIGGPMPVTNPNLYVIPVATGSPTWGANATLYFNFFSTPYAF